MIKDNVLRIKERISSICQRLGRNPQDIILVGVTKFAPIEKIEEVIAAGISHIAENKLQEVQKKYPFLKTDGKPVTRHMIGHLQTNKVKDALKHFDLIQSVDSLKLAEEIEKQAGKINRVADILVQINTAAEEQKFGAGKDEAMQLIEEILNLSHVKVLGLMAMAPLTADEKVVRKTFSDLREIKNKAAVQFQGHPSMGLKYLSMGMSGDFEIALEEGSNMVRIGSAIFHERTS